MSRLLALVLSVSLIGACGGSGDTSGETADATQPSPTPTMSAPTTSSTITPSSSSARTAPPPCNPTSEAFASGQLTHGGFDRVHNVAVPPGDGPFPVVFNLHGASGTKDNQDAATGLPATGVHEGFITVTPQATGAAAAWTLDPTGADVGYLVELTDLLVASSCVDAERIYLAGFSMGAIMAMQLACVTPERYAAVGAVGGLVELEACATASVTVPLVAVHGTADPSIGYDGAMSSRVTELVGYQQGPSVPDLAAAWAARNGCTDAPQQQLEGDSGTRFDYCDDVTLLVVAGLDHVWPGPSASTSVDANEVLWSFFEQRARAG